MTPSWLRWPPNCCETCVGPWVRTEAWAGRCEKHDSLEVGIVTDARFRCPAFQRRPDDPMMAEPEPKPLLLGHAVSRESTSSGVEQSDACETHKMHESAL